jgi:hypothetical protein
MTCFNCYSIHADQYSSSISKRVASYYCDIYQTDLEKSYERHVIPRHPKRPSYPSKVDLERKEMGNIV